MGTNPIGPSAIVGVMTYYSSTDEYEVGHGELVGPHMVVRIVVRRYDMSMSALFKDESPIKFVPLNDIEDSQFDLAIYMPQYLFDGLPTTTLRTGMESLIYIAGVTFHDSGPDAVSRLG